MHVLYFAWVKERIGVPEETITPPPNITDVGSLLDWLTSRGPGYQAALSDRARIRVAVNQDHAQTNTRICDGDEVAIFPPVTGG